METIKLTIGSAKYLSWWYLSDLSPGLIRQCETLAKLVCRASSLKSDDYRYKGAPFYEKACQWCALSAKDDVEHMVMSCPYNNDMRIQMFNELSTNIVCGELWQSISARYVLCTLLGGTPDNSDLRKVVTIWSIASKWIHQMYQRVTENRTGVG